MADSTSKYAVEITAETAQFQAAMTRAASGAESASKRMTAAFGGVRTAAAALGGLFGAAVLAGFVKNTIAAAENLQDLAEATGSSVESLSRLKNIAAIGGRDFESFSTAIERLAAGMAGAEEGSSKTAAALQFLGIQAKDPALALEEIAKKLAKFADGASKAALVKDLFGRNGVGFIATLNDIANAGDTSATVLARQAAEATRLADAFRRLQVESNELARIFLTDIVPSLANMVEQFAEGRKLAGGFFEALRLFGTINPFRDTGENIRALTKELEGLREVERGGGPLFAKSLTSAAELSGSIDDITKKLAFLKFQQRQAALALISPSNDDARDIRARARPELGFVSGAGKDRGVKDKADEFAKAIERIKKAAAEADLELAAMFSTHEITSAQKALAALTSSDEWQKFTGPQQQELSNRLQAIDAIQRETLEWKHKHEEQQKEIKTLEDIQAAQQQSVAAFTASLGVYADENAILERQIALVGQDDLAREKLVATIEYERLSKQGLLADGRAGIAILEQQFQKRIALIGQLSNASKEFAATQEITNVFVNDFSNALVGLADGTTSLRDAFRNLAKSLVHDLNQIAAKKLAQQLFGDGTSSGSGIFGELLAKLFGWGSGLTTFDGFSGFGTGPFTFADGGSPPLGKVSIVGERGPELFIPKQVGTIVPNGRSGLGQVTNHITINVPASTSSATADQIAVRTGAAIQRAMRRNG